MRSRRVADMPENRASHSETQTSWRNLTKFKIEKCKVLHLE